jgi:hypothetical protein
MDGLQGEDVRGSDEGGGQVPQGGASAEDEQADDGDPSPGSVV